MAGRTRRVRILVLLFFAIVVYVLYNRNITPVDDYREYFKDKGVGGGSVIRPKPEEGNTEPTSQSGPAPVQLESPTPIADQEATTSSTSTALPTTESSSQQVVAKPTPAPAVVPDSPHDGEDEFPHELGEGRVEVPVMASPTTSVAHWSKMPEIHPLSSTIQLPSGTPIAMPRVQRAVKKLADNGADAERLAVVKGLMQNVWDGYREHAWAMDEIRPVSGRYINPFNGWGATLVDSLDTLWIAGMKKEFEEAVEAVAEIDFTTSVRSDIPIFETTIRYLGGLIAAYDVSGREHIILLHKAVELAEVMFGIFDTPNRMPQTYYRWKPSYASQPHRASTRVVLAEIGTLSLEFTRLAQLTKEPKYYDAVARITDAFDEWQNSTRIPGMWPTSFDASGCGKAPQTLNPSGTLTKLSQSDPQPVPNGEGTYMDAAAPVSAGKVDHDPNAPSLDGSQKSLEGEKLGELGSSKRKRDVDLESMRDALTAKVAMPAGDDTAVKGVSKERNLRSPLATPPQRSTMDNCVHQGFRSTSKGSQETFTLSGASDSMYEYLPKQYALLGGLVDQYRTMYLASAEASIERLLYKPMTKDERDILMTGELKITPNYSQPIDVREYIEIFKPEAAHLACFAGGMFAMGGALFNKPEHIEIGSKLTDGCVWAYNVTATGVMPEGAELMQCEDTWGDCPWNETAYWRALDPYADTRGQLPISVASQTDEDDDDDGDDDMVGPQVSSTLNKQAAADAATKASGSKVVKRQLGEEYEAPTRPRPRYFEMAPAPQPAPPASIYTPEPAPTHEEYVRKKIEEERLPPGYTRIGGRKYILRPEAIESAFYMYRITGDQYWRDAGWNMFTSIDRHTRTVHGNSAIDDVTKSAPTLLDQMESFWTAETLKYFYLLFDEPEKWSLDEWVFNTEAHLFRRPTYEFTDA
ncbi:hypothetical protein LTR37_014794 [Vermiconidia calcicola]|uniref:Uncharacterized protein n=1 Tax=Vermiconidia calcicola TaxID=1690605 RepID=A0ACC3MSE8_9PEZI|nr:hypothetical protein LTR37_014794 [Vermiconidia calcicola]